jgi:hypothetical protein
MTKLKSVIEAAKKKNEAFSTLNVREFLGKYKLSDVLGDLGNYLSEHGYPANDGAIIDEIADDLIEYADVLHQMEEK